MYSWIGRQEQLHKKLICQQTEIATDIPKPPLESSRKGASSPGVSFCIVVFCEVVLWQIFNNGFTKKTHLGGMRLAETFQTAVLNPP